MNKMDDRNLVLSTDSYKLTHWNQYPEGTETVYSYFESRKGAKYNETILFGLQALLTRLQGEAVSQNDIHEAARLASVHFSNAALFNKQGWEHVVNDHGGRLPIRIKAVPEGTPVAVSNVLMTVENTCPKCFWLTNALESYLTHVWYPSTVATLSRDVKKRLHTHLLACADSAEGLPFMLHDFGYRGATGDGAAAIGGAGHLVNFMGTDTLPAMVFAINLYNANINTLAFSVPATEHSVMTARGPNGEYVVVDQLLNTHPTGILSVVADSYNIYRFVETVGSEFLDRIKARDGVFVVRPDSVTQQHNTPAGLTAWIVQSLWEDFGGTTNSKGYRVLDSHVRVLWGDGITPDGINAICVELISKGFSIENMVFGMGGGLLQKIDRDTQRFAFKSSAQKRNGEWYNISKNPLDDSKKSKRGRLKLVDNGNGPETLPIHWQGFDLMNVVFENGELKNKLTFDEIRKNAEL